MGPSSASVQPSRGCLVNSSSQDLHFHNFALHTALIPRCENLDNGSAILARDEGVDSLKIIVAEHKWKFPLLPPAGSPTEMGGWQGRKSGKNPLTLE
jgi:hypothetical protein